MKAKYDVELVRDEKTFATLSFDSLADAQADLANWIRETYKDKDVAYTYRLIVTFSHE